jgi:hypothetical protein
MPFLLNSSAVRREDPPGRRRASGRGRWVVFDAEAAFQMDATGVAPLEEIIDALTAGGTGFAVAG